MSKQENNPVDFLLLENSTHFEARGTIGIFDKTSIRGIIEKGQDGRWVIYRTVASFPNGNTVTYFGGVVLSRKTTLEAAKERAASFNWGPNPRRPVSENVDFADRGRNELNMMHSHLR